MANLKNKQIKCSELNFWGTDFELFLHGNREQIKKKYSHLFGEQCDLRVSECRRYMQLLTSWKLVQGRTRSC